MSALSSFYRHATAGSPNPVDGAARPTAALPGDAVLAPAEAARVWVAACRLGPKSAALIGLVLLDGLKTSELLPLDVDDVRFASGATFVGIERGDQPGVDVMVDRRTGGALRRYVGRRVDGPLFVGDNPTREPARLTRFGVDYLVKRAGAAAGLATPLTVNALRRRQADGDRGPRSTR